MADIVLNSDRLIELGYGSLTERQAQRLLKALYDAGEYLTGAALAETMSPAQLDQFEKFIDANDEPGALAWLERNFPDYRDVVGQTFDTLLSELRALAAERAAARDYPSPGSAARPPTADPIT